MVGRESREVYERGYLNGPVERCKREREQGLGGVLSNMSRWEETIVSLQATQSRPIEVALETSLADPG